MSRPAGPLTIAIRQLLDDTKGAIKYKEARPILKKAGFDIVPDPVDKSAELIQWELAESGIKRKPAADNPAAVKTYHENVAAKCSFTPAQTTAVLTEISNRAAFAAETNNFNVTKFHWTKAQPSPSRKPVSKREVSVTKNQPVVKRNVGRPRRQPAVAAVNNPSDVLSKMNALGGLQALEARIDTLQIEMSDLEALRQQFNTLQEQVKAAA